MASEINNFVGEEYLRYIYIADSTYTIKLIIDTFTDLLWTERYCGYGEFEITLPINTEILKTCHVDDYVMIRESDTVMIVETIGVHTDSENGDTLTISGRTLDSLLDRRIVLDESIGRIDDEGNPSSIGVQEAIFTMIANNAINPNNPNRRIPNLSFKYSTDPRITSKTMEAFQNRGDNLYDKVVAICQDNDIGFKVNAVGAGGFQFELYFGMDRSWDQTNVPAVVFSASYENLSNSDYLKTLKNYKNVSYVDWKWQYDVITQSFEGMQVVEHTETYDGETVTESFIYEYSGLSRRELYVTDSTIHDIGSYGPYWVDGDIPTNIPNMSAGINQAKSKGRQELTNYKTTTYFEGETEPFRQFVYGVDYFLGDIVQLEDKYGQTGKCRITEIARSRDSSGVVMIPTFKII